MTSLKLLLYYTDEDQITVKFINDMEELIKLSTDDSNWPALIHISFFPPLASSLTEDMRQLPKALYGSRSFIEAQPQKEWSFSSKLNSSSDIVSFFNITASPVGPIEYDSLTKKALEQHTNVEEHLSIEIEQTNDALKNQGATISKNEFEKLVSNDALFNKDKSRIAGLSLPNYLTKKLKRSYFEWVSDLTSVGVDGLLELPEFSEKDIVLISNALAEVDVSFGGNNASNLNEDNVSLELGDSFLGDIKDAVAKLNEKDSQIFKRRAGLILPTLTLRELGTELGTTGNAARQLQEKSFEKFDRAAKPVALSWLMEISSILENRSSALSLKNIEEEDERFLGISEKHEFLSFLFDRYKALCKERIYVSEIENEYYLTRVNKDEIKAFEDLLIQRFGESIGQTIQELLENFCAEFSSRFTDILDPVFDSLVNRYGDLQNNSEDRLVLSSFSYGPEKLRAGELLKTAMLERRQPMSRANIEEFIKEKNISINISTVMSLVINDGDFVLIDRGLYTHYQHLGITELELSEIGDVVTETVRALAKEQFNSAEVLNYLPNRIKNRLNVYQLTSVLKKLPQFQYISNNEFNVGGSENPIRLTNKEVFVEVLEQSERPMHKKELLEVALSLKSKWIDPNIQIQATSPLEALGKNWWALDYWEHEKKQIPTEGAAQKQSIQNNSKEITTTVPDNKEMVTLDTINTPSKVGVDDTLLTEITGMGFDKSEFYRMVDEVNSNTYYTDLDESDREKVRLLAKKKQAPRKLIAPKRAEYGLEQPGKKQHVPKDAGGISGGMKSLYPDVKATSRFSIKNFFGKR